MMVLRLEDFEEWFGGAAALSDEELGLD